MLAAQHGATSRIPALQQTVVRCTVCVAVHSIQKCFPYAARLFHRGSLRLDGVNLTSPDLDSLDCPSNATIRLGSNLTCFSRYTIRPSDLELGALYFRVSAGSASLRPGDQLTFGSPVIINTLATPQLNLDVVARSCQQVAAAPGEHSAVLRG